MDAKIEKIILWPKNPNNQRREVDFDPKGDVNVVTGWSQKGKSALIHIMDYCLGSEKCAIPIGEVRNKVEWFGLVLRVPEGQMLLARRNPGNEVQSPEMFMRTGKPINIPEVPTNPDGRDAVIRQLNVSAGLPARQMVEESSGFDGPPSFRDMAAFQFQPQHIIANPYTLFFKADTIEHREKLARSVLPYVLGAVDSKTLEAQARLRRLEGELRLKREQLEQARRAATLWLGKLQAFYGIARDNNLIPNAPEPETSWTAEVFASHLATVEKRLRDQPLPGIPAGATRRAAREVNTLKKEYHRLLRNRDDCQRKLQKLGDIRASVDGFSSALGQQAERLAPAGWLAERLDGDHECPLCGERTERGREAITKLAASAKEVSGTIAKIATRDAAFEAEVLELEKQATQIEVELQQVESRLESLEQHSAEMKAMRDRRDFIHGFAGELRAALESIHAGSSIGVLAAEEKKLAEGVTRLERDVNEGMIRRKIKTALESIRGLIAHYARILGVEHAARPWELDERSLTLKTGGAGERSDYLWEIGSAANWMGFHIATLLALHEHFRTVAHNPVPKFLVLDQPSQAFFPEGVAAAKAGRRSRGQIGRSVDDDLKRLKRVFEAFSEATVRTKRGLQMIVLEHAEAGVWQGVPHIKKLHDWRGDDALVPTDWK